MAGLPSTSPPWRHGAGCIGFCAGCAATALPSMPPIASAAASSCWPMADAVSDRWKKLHGSIPALITPFRDGLVDHEALTTLAERQIRRGSAGLVAAGRSEEHTSELQSTMRITYAGFRLNKKKIS